MASPANGTHLVLLALVVRRPAAPGTRLLITLDMVSMCWVVFGDSGEITMALVQAAENESRLCTDEWRRLPSCTARVVVVRAMGASEVEVVCKRC